MADKPAWQKSRRGRLNRATTEVRLALFSKKFDAMDKWLEAFSQLEDLYKMAETDDVRFLLLKERMSALEKLFTFLYPKVKETEVDEMPILEGETVKTELIPEKETTENLIKMVEEYDRSK